MIDVGYIVDRVRGAASAFACLHADVFGSDSR